MKIAADVHTNQWATVQSKSSEGGLALRPDRGKYVLALEATEASRIWRSAGLKLGLQRWTGNLHGHQSPPRAIGMRAKDGSRS